MRVAAAPTWEPMEAPIGEIVRQSKSLAPFPRVALRVMELSTRPQVVPKDIIDVIQVDPGLTAKVLKLCNSAYYGFQREIASIAEAGTRLGTETLANLVLTSCTGRYFRDYGGATGGSHDKLWKHCVANAISARILAENAGIDRELAYTIGLLQNVGHLVLDRFVAAVRDALAEEVERGSTLLDAERRVLGMHHAELGARLLTRWGMPDVLVDTTRCHHTPLRARRDPLMCATVHLAESLTWAVGITDSFGELTHEVSAHALDACATPKAGLAALVPRLEQELGRAGELLEI